MNSSIQNQPQKKKESEEEKSSKQGLSSTKQPTTIITSPPPPSTSSSPSHEFSFTISLHPPPSSTKPPEKTKTKTTTTTNTNTNPPSFIDLSPADDIFFHGHLLPLHFLSQLPTSPRSSSNSLDSFTLPIKELLTDDQKPMKNNNNNNNNSNSNSNSTSTSSNNSNSSCHNNTKEEEEEEEEPKERIKAKSFSFLRFSRWRKGYEIEEKEKKKKKMGSSVTQILRKYVGMVRPLLFYKGGRSRERSTSHSSNSLQCRQTYSFSGNLLSLKGKQELRGGRRGGGEYSAPASMWTSPTNSGLLLTTPVPASSSSSSSSESTMEELQSAIQAAIAHCKNSITLKDENKQQCEIK